MIYRNQRRHLRRTRKYYLPAATACSRKSRPPTATVLEIACGTGRNLILGPALSAATSPLHIWRRRAHGGAAPLRGRASRSGSRSRTATRPASRAPSCSSSELRSRLHLLRAVDDPAVARCRSRGLARGRPGRLAPRRRFRREARLPAWFRSGLERWLAKFAGVAQTSSSQPILARRKGPASCSSVPDRDALLASSR